MSFAQNAGKEIATGVKAAEKVAAGVAKKAPKVGVKIPARLKTPKLPKIYRPTFNATPNLTIPAISRAHTLTDEKVILNQVHKATLETRQANTLLNTLMKDPLYYISSEEGQKAGLSLIDKTVTNRSLRTFLRTDLLARDVHMLVEDLVNYYTLSHSPVLKETPGMMDLMHLDGKEAFVDTAFDYLLTHPHKVNLKLRHMMQSPLVANETKGVIQHFINMPKPAISGAEKAVLRGALAEAYTQYARGIQAAKTTDNTKETVTVYARTLTDLQEFVKANGRLPKWSTLDNNELMLYTRTETLMNDDRANHFEPVAKLSAQIKALFAEYAPVYPSEQETLKQLKAFMNKNHRFPQARPGNPGVSEEEANLNEAVMHWLVKGNSPFQAAMNEIVNGLL